MKQKKLILTVVFIFPLIWFFSSYLSFRYSGCCDLNCQESVSLQDGDLVFRRGKSIESYTVSLADKAGEYSHVGLIKMKGRVPYVIHAEPGESPLESRPVKMEPLSAFLCAEKASHYAIYRSALGQDALRKVMKRAMSFYTSRRCFDTSFDLTDDSRVYCTELVLKSYQSVNPEIIRLTDNLSEVNLLTSKQKVLLPGALIKSTFFHQIFKQ